MSNAIYHKHYLRPSEQEGYMTHSTAADPRVTVVEVVQYQGQYTREKKFLVPEQSYECDEYCRALEWAYQKGKNHMKGEIREGFCGLLGL